MAATVTNPGGRQFKTILRIEKAVRLEAMQIPYDDIARHLGMTRSALDTLRQTDEYQAAKITHMNGILSEMDSELGNDINYLREKLHSYVPAALNTLVKALGHPDTKIALTAAESLLDREGKLAKVSRVGLPDEDQGGIGPKVDTSTADALIATLATLRGTQAKGVDNGSNTSNQTTGNDTSNGSQTNGPSTGGTTTTSS